MIVSTEYEAKSEGSIDRKFTITHGRVRTFDIWKYCPLIKIDIGML